MINDPRSSAELCGVALASWNTDDTDDAWAAIGRLWQRGSAVEFHLARHLYDGDDPLSRQVGIAIMGQLGEQQHPFHDEVVTMLIAALGDLDPGIISAAAIALGHRNDPRAIPALVALHTHPDAEIRGGVGFGLLGHDDPQAIAALITLSQDAEDPIRDWATFGLGTQIDTDTPAIRAALWQRVQGEPWDSEAANEALVGLARRRDPDVYAHLRSAIQTGEYSALISEAAELLGDRRLLAPLRTVLKTCEHDDTINAGWLAHLRDAVAALEAEPTIPAEARAKPELPDGKVCIPGGETTA